MPGRTSTSSGARGERTHATRISAPAMSSAFILFGLRGTSLVRILQSIAAGQLGREALAGGTATALLRLVRHFTIAFTIVGVYFPMLIRHVEGRDGQVRQVAPA